MNSRSAVAAVAVAAFLVAGCNGESSSSSETGSSAAISATETSAAAQPSADTADGSHKQYTFKLVGGHKAQGPDTISVKSTEAIMLDITSDVAEEVHAHGFNKEAELAPGVATHLQLEGAPTGVYELELHHSGVKISTITVE